MIKRIFGVVAVVALLAGCGAGPAPAGASSPARSAVTYSACIRAHGVPGFPDPVGDSQLPKADPQQLGVSSATLQAAQAACQNLIPAAVGENQEQQQETQCAMAGNCSQATLTKWMSGLRSLAACLRTHGEPNWPDPILTAQGLPHFDYDNAGIDHHSSQVLAQVDQCVQITGFAGLPLP